MAKRIKLKVQRNRLPPVDVLWAVKEQEGHEQCTVAKLIADVNHAIPLEAGDWTLDQYVVELDGYECLHYQFVSDVLKDGDSVIIRPLASPDVRARRLGGRTQITGEGFHILDGVPYGMQPNQRPARPGILIPSRKRRRPELDEEDYADDEGTTIADIEDDEDLLAHVNGGTTIGELVTEPEHDEEERPRKRQKNVHFNVVKDIPNFEVEEDDEDEGDDDFDPHAVAGSNDDAESGDEEEAETEAEAEAESEASDDSSNSDSSSEVSSTGSDDSSSSGQSDFSVASIPEIQSSRPPTTEPKVNGTRTKNGVPAPVEAYQVNFIPDRPHDNIPFDGKRSTKDRNKRRRVRTRILRRVRDILGLDATKEECSDWLQNNPELSEQISSAVQQSIDNLGRQAKGQNGEEEFIGFPEEMDEAGDSVLSVTVAPTTTNGDQRHANTHENASKKLFGTPDKSVSRKMVKNLTKEPTDLKRRRQELLDAIAAGGIVNTSSDTPISITEAEKEANSATKRSSPSTDSPSTEGSDAKRVRLNINGSRRAIFNALGQRTPKTQEDADRVRAKLAGLGRPKTIVPTVASREQDQEEDPLSDAWRSKIRLMAVDCDNPEIKLSEPPYPFKQRWDQSQQRNKPNWWANGGKQKKRKGRQSYGRESNEEEDDVSYLEYDEPGYYQEEAREEEYADGETKLAEFAETQLLPEGTEQVTDLPSLPADISTLPNLKPEDVTIGAIIAFKQLECNQATNWAPVMASHRTAKIIGRSAQDIQQVELAIRDRDIRQIKYDQDGKRVYEKFEMDAGEEGDEDVDDGIRDISFVEMVEPKLVRAAQDAVAKAEAATD